MIIKLRSYLLGGGLMASIYLPVVTTLGALGGASAALYAINLLNGTTGASGKSSSSEDKGRITEKDLYTGLYKTIAESGLASDSQYIISKIQQDIFNGNLLDPFGDSSDLTNQYLKALSYVNLAKNSLTLYDSAYKQSIANGSISEAAVTSTGEVVVKTKEGKITQIPVELYLKNKSSYLLMTNGNVLAERMNNPNCAFRNGLIDTVLNSTSMKEITTLIKDIVSKVGSTTSDISGYVSKKDLQISGGILILQEAASKYGAEAIQDTMSVKGLYKIGVTDTNSQAQVRAAIESVYLALSPQLKTLLALKSNGKASGVLDLIGKFIGTGVSSSYKFDVDLESGVDADGNKVGKAASAEANKDDARTSFLTNVLRGIGGNELTYVMNPGNTAELSVTGTHYGLILTPKGEAVGKTSLLNMLSKSMLLGITDVRSIYFGDLLISPDKLKDVTYENLGAIKVLLPAVNNESLWRPNFEYFEAYEAAAKAVRARGLDPNDNTSEAAMKALAEELEKLGLYDLIDRNTGLPDTRLVRPFLVTNGYATSKSGILNSKYIKEVNDDLIVNDVINTLSEKGPDGKVHKYDYDVLSIWNPFDWMSGWHDHLYYGTIYIPISTNELSGITASGLHIKSRYGELREQEYQNSWKQINAGRTYSDVLK